MQFLVALLIAQGEPKTTPIWAPTGVADDADSHVAFRGAFNSGTGPYELRMVGASGYLVWLDGKLIEDGPARFSRAFPEYQTLRIQLGSGKHLLSIHMHTDGVTTRMLSAMRPFLWCEVVRDRTELPIQWKCARIPGYRHRVRRISDILGWTDWFDTSQSWINWEQPGFDDSGWANPSVVDPGLGPLRPARTTPVRMNEIPIHPIAHGSLTENFGYETDDPPTRFFLRNLHPSEEPVQGVWRRYDLGRVRLGRPRIVLNVAKGSTVEVALCEQLQHGRVHGWITLSGSQSCNLDHFVARGGTEEFMPMTPKGGRFMEVHVLTRGPVRFLKEAFLERTYYGEPTGSFECDDPLLNRIWKTGVDTVRACSDDALVDCPTRERGEWTGDVATVSTDICAVAYSDLSLSRRALVQAAQSARGDGLVAGVGPGDPGYLSSYAAQWVSACVHYWELTGDKTLLVELLPAAQRNVAAFQAKMTPAGLSDDLGWGFIDWGYVRNEGGSDIAVDLHYLMALRSMIRWQTALEPGSNGGAYVAMATSLEGIVRRWLDAHVHQPGGWKNVGYHRAALALLAGLVHPDQVKPCISAIESHLLACFPNDPSGPRLSDPSLLGDRFMTPYFCHFAFAALLDRGEIDFVLNQYRKCWGWALSGGRTTWLEVFDPRWSQCHEWSGCPTWQLSRYVLGLRSRFDLGEAVYDVNIQPGFLKHAEGKIPTASGGSIDVSWTASDTEIKLVVRTTRAAMLRFGSREITVHRNYSTVLPRK